MKTEFALRLFVGNNDTRIEPIRNYIEGAGRTTGLHKINVTFPEIIITRTRIIVDVVIVINMMSEVC